MNTGFEVMNAEQLRDIALELQRAAAREYGETLDISESSDAHRTAAAHALLLEMVHARILLKTQRMIFPDTSEPEDLEHHARIYGMTRKPAIGSRLRVLVGSGRPDDETIILSGEMLGWRDGTKYLPVSADGTPLASVALVAGSAEVLVEAQSAGASTTRIAGDELVWSTAPAGLLSSVEILAVTRTGADAEGDVDFAQRVSRRLVSSPASGNCDDWSEWCERFPQVHRAFIYPATKPGAETTNRTPGAVCAVIVGAAPNPILSPGDADSVKAYIEGEKTLDGDVNAEPRRHQLRFCSLDPNDITVMAAIPLSVDVFADLEVVGETLPPWRATPFTTDVGCTDTVLQVTANPIAAGVEPGQYVAVGTGVVVGGWEIRRVASRGATSITLDAPLSMAPAAGAGVRAAWSKWEQARDAILDLFAGLGPGDYSNAEGGPTRWPDVTREAPPRLFPSGFVAVLLGFYTGSGKVAGVPGVRDVTVITPSATVIAAPQELPIPGTITFTLA